MSDSALALISTLAWIALIGVILGLFGRSEGGAWSIAGGVARGVRDWSNGRGRERRTPTISSPAPLASSAPTTSAAAMPAAPATPPASSPSAEVDDLGSRPIAHR